MIKVEHNIETGEIIEREMTEAELAEYNADIQALENQRIAAAEEATAKTAAKAALLDKLGITEEEAELLA